VAWGWNQIQYGQTDVPSGLNLVAIAAGGQHSLALTGLPPGVAAPAWVGRGRNSTAGAPSEPVKEVYVQPLRADFRQRLCAGAA
jgi:hypothetical protein